MLTEDERLYLAEIGDNTKSLAHALADVQRALFGNSAVVSDDAGLSLRTRWLHETSKELGKALSRLATLVGIGTVAVIAHVWHHW